MCVQTQTKLCVAGGPSRGQWCRQEGHRRHAHYSSDTHEMRRKYEYIVFQGTDTLFVFFKKMQKKTMSLILISVECKILKIDIKRKNLRN